MRGQVAPRPVGMFFGLDLSLHPFSSHPSYKAIADRPLAERVAAMRDPVFRARLLAETAEDSNPVTLALIDAFRAAHEWSDGPDYEPQRETRIEARAAAAGQSVAEFAYELLLKDGGRRLFYLPAANYSEGNLNAVREMLGHPDTVMALADGGAHYGLICDASFPTYFLQRWVRDADPGDRIALADAIAELTARPAATVGMTDRGRIAEGMKADLNIIDFNALRLHVPTIRYDLPAAGSACIRPPTAMSRRSYRARSPIATGSRRARCPAGSCGGDGMRRQPTRAIRRSRVPPRVSMKDDTDFAGKAVLVVGGSSGIGNGIAHGFRARGAAVHVWGTRAQATDYDPDDGSDLAGLGYSCVDVGDPDAIEAAAMPFDRLDVLILCQGTVVYRRCEFEREGWDRVMAVNLDSLMHISRKFRLQLSQSAGSIIIVSSISGLKANIGNPAYAASKAGAISLTKTLGQAFAADGIRVNGLAPGLVDTKLTKVTTQHPDRLEGALTHIPQRRMGTPEDMAGAAIFLASPLASYVTGHTLIVDGGLSL